MRALLYNMFILLRDRFLWKSGLYLWLHSIQLSIKRIEHKSDYNRCTNYLIQNSCLCKSQDAIKVFIHATCCVYVYILRDVVDIDRLFRRIGEMRESIFRGELYTCIEGAAASSPAGVVYLLIGSAVVFHVYTEQHPRRRLAGHVIYTRKEAVELQSHFLSDTMMMILRRGKEAAVSRRQMRGGCSHLLPRLYMRIIRHHIYKRLDLYMCVCCV